MIYGWIYTRSRNPRLRWWNEPVITIGEETGLSSRPLENLTGTSLLLGRYAHIHHSRLQTTIGGRFVPLN